MNRTLIVSLIALVAASCGEAPVEQDVNPQASPIDFSAAHKSSEYYTGATPLGSVSDNNTLSEAVRSDDAFWAYHSSDKVEGSELCQNIKGHILNGTINDFPLSAQAVQEPTDPNCLYLLSNWLFSNAFSNAFSDSDAIQFARSAALKGSLEARLFIHDLYRKQVFLNPGELTGSEFADFNNLNLPPTLNDYFNLANTPIPDGLLLNIDTTPDANDLPHRSALKAYASRAQKNSANEFANLRASAQNGNHAAQYELARLLTVQNQKLTPESIYWYRAASFQGSPHASISLGAYLLRAYGRGKTVEAPEGQLSGNELLDAALGAYSYASILGSDAASATLLTLINDYNFPTNPTQSEAITITDELKKFLVNVQPTGALSQNLYPEMSFAWRSRTGTEILTSGISHHIVKSGKKIDVNLLVSSEKNQRPFLLDRVEIWDTGPIPSLAKSINLSGQNSLILPVVCTQWYGEKTCPKSNNPTISTKGLSPGAYLIRYVEKGGAQFSPALLQITGPPRRASEENSIAVIHPDYTWQAYNTFGGGSIYVSPLSNGVYAANLDRPLNSSLGKSEHNFRSSLAVANYLKESGYNTVNLLQSEIGRDPAKLNGFNNVVVIGHDEYWDDNIRSAYIGHIEDGGRLMFMSGNTGWYRVVRKGKMIAINKSDGANPAIDNPALNKVDLTDTGLYLRRREPNDERIATLTGSTYESGGYAVRYYLDRDKMVQHQIPVSIYNDSDMAYTLNANHPIFTNIEIGPMDTFCKNSAFIDAELDGSPLIGPHFIPNSQWLSYANPNRSMIAASYMFNPNYSAMNGRPFAGILHFSGLISEAPYGDNGGGVFTIGSMGAYRLVGPVNPQCQQIVSNMFQYFTGSDFLNSLPKTSDKAPKEQQK